MPHSRQPLAVSLAMFALLIAALVAIKFSIDTKPDLFRSASQTAVFAWEALAIFAAVGALGTILAYRSDLPGMWNTAAPIGTTLIAPVLIGFALGAVAIAVDLQTHWTSIVAAKLKLPSIHIAYPASAIIYPGGAIIVSIIYFLVPISLLGWLASFVVGVRGRAATLWILCALAAAVEPATQDAPNPSLSEAANVLVFASDYVLNLAQARTFVTLGFWPAVLIRIAFYGVWHVAWGAFQGV